MGTNEVTGLGPIGATTVAAVKRLRRERRWSLAELSERLAAVSRPILPTGLHRLENGQRRVDVDDLVALALVLGVSPVTLLLPMRDSGDVALTEEVTVGARDAWAWARAQYPLTAGRPTFELTDLTAAHPRSEEDAEPEAYRVLDFHRSALPVGIRPPLGYGLDAARPEGKGGDVFRERGDDG